MQQKLLKLKNNLPVIFIQAPGSKAACVQIWFRAGSSLETYPEFGIAHFLEHMFFKGTAKYPGAALTKAIEAEGAEVNAFTSFDCTCYYINSPQHALLKNTAILLDMVTNPLFPPQDFSAERQVVLEEFHRSVDDPRSLSMMKLQEKFFAPPYQHPILGTAPHIKKFSRTVLQNFRKKYYNVQNAFLILAGDFSEKAAIKLIEKFKLPRGKKSSFTPFAMKGGVNFDVYPKETPMATLTIATSGHAYGTAAAAQEELAWAALADGESSPLYQALVREQAIANNCLSYTSYRAQGSAALLRISFPAENLEALLRTWNKVVCQIFAQGFSKEDIEKVKQQFLARKIYRLETLENMAFDLGENFARTGDLQAENSFEELIKQATPALITQSLGTLLGKNLRYSLQFPQAAAADLAGLKNKFGELIKQSTTALQAALQKTATLKLGPATSLSEDKAVQLYTLRPGVKFIYRYNPTAPTFNLRIALQGGQILEEPSQQGITSLLSNTITKGHTGWTSTQIDQFLETRSATLEGISGKNSFGLSLHGQSKDFMDLAALWAGCLTSPCFPEKFVEQEKELALRQLAVQANDPAMVCFRQMAKHIFAGHPYQENILGNPESLANLNRDHLLLAWKKYLATQSAVITFVGSLSLPEVLPALPSLINFLPARPSDAAKINLALNPQDTHQFLPLPREQQHILYAVPIKQYFARENLALKILTTFLSGQGSPLFTRMRDELGLCYAVQPVHYNLIDGGYWGIYLACGEDRASEAQKALQEFWQQLLQHSLSLSEFKAAKVMLQGQRDLDLQTNEDYANVYTLPVLHHYPLGAYYQQNKDLQKLGFREFQKMVRQILKRPLSIMRVGGGKA